MNLTCSYEKICDLITYTPEIVSKEDLYNHLHTVCFTYTKDDVETAYAWAQQAVKRVIVHSFGEQALHV